MEREVLALLLDELERRRRSREMNRYLRDVNDPFFLPEALFRQHYRLSREAARDVFPNPGTPRKWTESYQNSSY
ncbi:unnamed protein product [Tenebrio molitor]|nr:unnamed protein product [Tenebrio molitor]